MRAFIILFAAIARAQTPVLSIDDAVALALKGNRQVQASSFNMDRAREGTAAVKTNRLRQSQVYVLGGETLRPLTFTIPEGALGVYPNVGPIPAQNSKITTPQTFTGLILGQISEPVTQQWKIHLATLSSRLSENLAREGLRQQKQDTAHSVRDLYYEVAQTTTQIESAEANVKYLVELQAETDRNLAEQTALKGDSLAVRAKLSTQRYQLLTLRDTLTTQKESLNHLLGRDLDTDFTVDAEPIPKPEEIDLAEARKQAASQRAEIRQSQLQTKKAEVEVRRQRAEYIPDVSVHFSYLSFPNVNFVPENIMQAGFLLQWQPFDWGQKRHKTEALRYEARQAALTEQDTSQRVMLDVNSKFRGLAETRAVLGAAAGAKYSYAQLDNYTDLIGRTLLGVSQTSRVERKGVLPQAVFLDYSQDRLASYGLQVTDLSRILQASNITLPGGAIEAGGREIQIDPSGKFEDARAIGNVILGTSNGGSPIYLRDVVHINRAYQSPAQYLNFYTYTGKDRKPHRSRAITLAVYMRSGEQIQKFGESIDEKMKQVRAALPPDLIVARTSDQPLQVRENIDLFMEALLEAIVLVVLIALVGFWEWRSALLMALSMPITLAMTFGMAHLVHIDLQQVSIATLIIALGLLVDDPVVANDAIKRELASGIAPIHAAWLGPTKLARAILYATATNIIAYLPFLMLTGSTGDFLYSLPIVMTAALVSSRLASMTFIPLLGYYLLRPRKTPEPSIEERRQRGFYGFYYRLAGTAIRWRWGVLALSFVFLGAGALIAPKLRSQFFPEDVQYWSYVDVWLPNDAPLTLTNDLSQRAEAIVQRVVDDYGRQHPGKEKDPAPLLQSVTTFVGGGGPRFWFSVSPEQQQRNYAQVLIQVRDKEATPAMIGPLQLALSREIAGAYVTVHQLQTNPVEFPVEVQISGTSDVDPSQEPVDNENMRVLAAKVERILQAIPGVQVVQNDWFEESAEAKLRIDSDRANLSGVTNRDVAASTTAAISGTTVTTLREGNLQIPVIARLRATERAQLSDVENLYVYSSQGPQKVPLRAVSSVVNQMTTERIRRQEHFRTIGVHAFPQPGILASEVLKAAMPKLKVFGANLPAGYRMQIGGENAKQQSGFANLAKVLVISLLGIYAALLVQFGNAVKPLLVFAATPYGVVGALLCLAIMGSPFGFMAFLGIASLIGVIVSHVIVLFDFIEEMHEKGEPFEQAVKDAGIERLRPVLITVGATILALFPLASHGGPLWKPLCYAQIGGLAVATFITLLLVPVFYSIAVLDLKIVKWKTREEEAAES